MTEAGVDSGQGYYFSRALPAAEATAWMELEAPLEREVA
jgi:EAL domain-containing protein (putative c-di-GMP-specific phosphodiesterase class I)